MKKFLLSLVFVPFMLFSLEEQPWFGNVYEFFLLSEYSYSRFKEIDRASPQLTKPQNVHNLYFDLAFSPSSAWNMDLELQCFATPFQDFNFSTTAFQLRYLWKDDVIGDPVSFSTGASLRIVTDQTVKDPDTLMHGEVEFEVNAAMGKEFDFKQAWRQRIWLYGALGQANKGRLFLKGVLSLEGNIHEKHKWALFARANRGYGTERTIDPNHFSGYGKVHYKKVDLGIRYGYRIESVGTLRLEYQRRILNVLTPKDVNRFTIGFLLPFSF
ncbi:MAG TPA: hypothetical protein P5048_05030 [Chlamydiales bacterium]|nr:hypothetical protein [Chlamydiales bacterium]